MKESDFQSRVIEEAKLYGWMYYHTYRSTRSVPGFPDLVLVRIGYPWLVVELKTEGAKETKEQAEWLLTMSDSVLDGRIYADVPESVRVDTWRPQDRDYIIATLANPDNTRYEYMERLKVRREEWLEKVLNGKGTE